jgi:Nidogen-like
MNLKSLPFCKLSAKIIGVAVTSIVFSQAISGVASAAAIRTGLFNTSTLPANDDGSSLATALGFTANLFGTNYTNTYVNNNGNFTFTSGLSTFTPSPILSVGTPIIAAFWADVDTRGTGTSPVTYGRGTVDGRNAFGANYLNAGYFSSGSDKLNDFQIVLIDRNDTGAGNFDIEFNYNKIQWETGGASGGSGGLGGSSARVGYAQGTAAGSSFELAGSAVNGAFLDGGRNSLVANSLNSNGVLGRYQFSARNGAVVTLPPTIPPVLPPTPPVLPPTGAGTDVPEPFTVIGSLIGGTAAFRMRKKLKSSDKA